MSDQKTIKNALISVFSKEGLEPVIHQLNRLGVTIYSTGGTQTFIEQLGVAVEAVEDLTTYPSILGGRVKTLHPKVFGGILGRRELESDLTQLEAYEIPEIDLVVVDLYPFEATVASGAAEPEVIEKIDIGGISLIRAAAKNYRDVLIVPSRDHYAGLLSILSEQDGTSALADRKQLAQAAFALTAHYDTAINSYFAGGATAPGPNTQGPARTLRYGENPHQEGVFYGDLDALFDQLHGKELSYNNLLDIDAAVHLMADFAENDPTVAILKHNNACGLATRGSLPEAWKDALAGDPVSAFGGIIVTNRPVDRSTAEGMHEIFFEVVIAPDYTADALEVLQQKKKRIILRQKQTTLPAHQFRTALNGMLFQNRDARTETAEDLRTVTEKAPAAAQVNDLLFANKLVKHTKSNTIVLAANGQLLASGTGQTSRVDALKQAIVKARAFGFDLQGAVMASDAFFPFADCVEIAHEAGINAVIQPGGSIRDDASINFCNENGMSMVFTGIRHFKH